MTQPLDLVIIGGGAAGLVAAHTAISVGASVALVEAERMGGDCLWTGCVPSKSLIAAANAAAHARSASRLGVHVGEVRVDFAEVMAHVHRSIATIEPVDSAQTIGALGVQVLQGTAKFTAKKELQVNGQPVPYRQVLIAAGSAPAIPEIAGLEDIDALTSESVWDLKELPARLVIIGGGNMGCELGQAFARLGSSVTIVEQGPRILPETDPDAVAVIQAALARDGVAVVANAHVEQVRGDGTMTVTTPEGPADLRYDRVLIAAGRTPRTAGLGLSHVGVDTTAGGYVQVDEHMRTSNTRIWAAGDVTNFPHFTHLAGMNALTATLNALLGLRRKGRGLGVPRVTYTDPEVASVGLLANSPVGRAGGAGFARLDNTHVDRAIAEADTNGFTKLTLDQKGKVLGAVVVGPRAGETLSELSLAVTKGLKSRDLAGQVHPYPTYSDGPWNAAIQDTQQRLDTPVMQRITGLATGFRRRQLDRKIKSTDTDSGPARVKPDQPRRN